MAGYRAGEVEVLLTVDDKDVTRAEKNVRTVGERIEKKGIKPKIDVDTADALAGMDRVEGEAKKLVSERAVLQIDADIARAEQQLGRAVDRLEDLQVRAEGGLEVTADVRRAEANLQRLERHLTGLKSARSTIDIEADPSDAIAAMDRVEAQKRIVSREVAVEINADVAKAESRVNGLTADLEILRSMTPSVKVDADVRAAEVKLARAEAGLRDLQGARAMMVVDVSTDGAEQKLKSVADYAEDAGEQGGQRGGAGLGKGIIAGLASIPVAGALVAISHTLADTLVQEFNSALQIEVRQDRLEALTGIDEASAARLARVAANAYANNFGESIESNMNTTRLALQFDILDADATQRDAQTVIEGLGGIADVLEEDVRPTATAVATLMRTGLARDAQHAYDLIAAGAREGLNRNEDLLDTLTEYPVVLERLGLSGEQSLGLINQGLKAGARNTDIVADALKEFQIRATDASTMSAAGFERLGLNAEEMTAKIARGGADARDGLQIVLDKLRETEDPVVRNAAAVELFGTKAEDLGAALFALDVTTAVDSLNGVEGAARRMFDTLANNDASKIEQAQRNVEVAAEGIKGALASAFAEPLGELADFVSQNRGPVMQFLLDLANGALDFGDSMVESGAAATEALGDFVSGPLADAAEGLAGIMRWLGQNDAADGIQEMVDGMRNFDELTDASAGSMRDVLGGAIEDARTKLNEFGEPAVAMGFLNDASLRLAESLAQVGYDGEGARLSLDGIDYANIRASESGRILEDQVRNSVAALSEEISAAQAAGASQDELTSRYNSGTAALMGQLQQMGLTEEQARALIDTVMETPAEKTTAFGSNAPEQQAKVQDLANRITTLPDGRVVVTVDTTPARNGLEGFIQSATGRRIAVYVDSYGGRSYQNEGSNIRYQARGGVLEFMAGGGIPGLNPMQSVAQMVPANTWRVVGDRGDVDEAFIPLDGSPRSIAILLEAVRRMPGLSGMGGGAVAGAGGGREIPPIQVVHHGDNYSYDPHDLVREYREQLTQALNALAIP